MPKLMLLLLVLEGTGHPDQGRTVSEIVLGTFQTERACVERLDLLSTASSAHVCATSGDCGTAMRIPRNQYDLSCRQADTTHRGGIHDGYPR